jgi:GxxExxY protein
VGSALGFWKRSETTLTHPLPKAGLAVAQQRGIAVTYGGITLGEYLADLLVGDAIPIEEKSQELDRVHRALCVNYLRAT